MDDKVILQIAGKRIENFISYEVEADLYHAADRFSLELATPDTAIVPGMHCELLVNSKVEMTGIIDFVQKGYSKQGRTLTVGGRDLLGILVDSYVEDFVTLKDKTIKEIAEFLIHANPKTGRPALPYISRCNIVGGGLWGGRDGGKPFPGFSDVSQEFTQPEPGMTVFEVLCGAAVSRGLMFFSRADGTMVFGRPKTKGKALYTLMNTISGKGNCISAAEETFDISQSYSKVTVIGPVKVKDRYGPVVMEDVPTTVVDETFPFYKPFVTKLYSDSETPDLYARMLLEKQRKEGYQLIYNVPGHSQGKTNFMINELAQVKDEMLEREGLFLIYNRKFKRSKLTGTTTELKLGPVGLVTA